MSNINNLPANHNSGLYRGARHNDPATGKPLGGIKTIVDGVKSVEIEGDEYFICREAMQSNAIFSFKQKTNKQILDRLFREEGCVFRQGFAKSGDFISCRLVVLDNKKRDINELTPKEILNILQKEKACKMTADATVNKLGGVFKETSPEELEARWTKKRQQIETLSNNIQRLRNNVSRDLKSDNEKISLTALVVAIMDRTSERIGNEASAREKHLGVTGFQKKNVAIIGNKIHLEYIGKSGVEHTKSFSDERIAKHLKKAIKNSPSKRIFTTSDGFQIKADRANRYLSDFGVTNKDIRGYFANSLVVEKLKKQDIPEKQSDRKKLYLKTLRSVAEKVGHGFPTLRKHYVIPELERAFIIDSKVIDISDRATYEQGGDIKPADCGCKHEKGGFLDSNELKIKKRILTDEYERKRGSRLSNYMVYEVDINKIFKVEVKNKDKKIIAEATFGQKENNDVIAILVSVEPEYKRKGIATFLYDEAEKHYKSKVVPSGTYIYDDVITKFWKKRNPNAKLEEGGDLDNSEKRVNLVQGLINNEIQHDISGTSNIRSGAIIQATSNYLKDSQRTSSEVKGSKHFKEQEEESLKSYITENNLWVSEKEFKNYISQGAEQKVYLINDKFVIKTNDSIFYNSWEDYLHSILLHNYFFPATAYELMGFHMADDVLLAVVKQPFVQETEKTDLESVKKFMAENGFVNTKNNDYKNDELGIILEDLHDENVLTENGVLQFVDTVFYISDKNVDRILPPEQMILPSQLLSVEPIILEILQKLKKSGSEALIVGGAVRDSIMHIEPKDIDIEVYHITYDKLRDVLSDYGKVDLVGKSFGIIKFKPRGAEMEYDFSVPRKENRMGVGHKGFEVSFDENMTIKEASMRRDFTFNSLAYDPITNTIYDYFGGVNDIEDKVIRHTSDKFSEDALRILRAMQFQARFGFSIHPDTIAEIKTILSTDEFNLIPKERVFDEWIKWAEKGAHHDLLFGFLNDTTLIEYYPMLKELKHTPQDAEWHPEGDVEIHTTLCLRFMDKIISKNDIHGKEKVILVMSILLHDIGKPATTKHEMKRGRMAITSNGHEALGGTMSKEFLEGIGFNESLITPICNLVTNHLAGVSIISIPKDSGKEKAVKKLSRRLAPTTISQLLLVMEADHNGRGSDVYKEPTGSKEIAEIAGSINVADKQYEYLLMGRHLIEVGLKPSRQFSEILSKANEAQENGEFSDVEGAKKWLNENLDKFLTGGAIQLQDDVLLAPNGKPSNLSQVPYNLVRTTEFKNWFGDWENDKQNSSKVLDENGEPLVVYHGTKTDKVFEFYKDFISSNSGNEGHFGYGFYFSDDVVEARTYTDIENPKIINAFLNIRNPFLGGEISYLEKYAHEFGYKKVPVAIDAQWLGDKIKSKDEIAYKLFSLIQANGYKKGWELFLENENSSDSTIDLNSIADWMEWIDKDSQFEIPYYIIEDVTNVFNEEPIVIKNFTHIDFPSLLYITNHGLNSRYLTAKMQEDGYDGVIIGSEYVAFESNQIKLATGENTIFDIKSNDIRFSAGGSILINKPETMEPINENNYFEKTKANFKIIAIGKEAEHEMNSLAIGRDFDYVSASGSKYIIIDAVVYRLSDHWGNLDTCTWNLIGQPSMHNSLVLATCPLADFDSRPEDKIYWENVVEYITQEVFKGKKLKSACKSFVKKFSGSINPFLGSGLLMFDVDMIEQKYYEDKATTAIKNKMKSSDEGSINFMSNYFGVEKERFIEELKKLEPADNTVMEQGGLMKSTNDDESIVSNEILNKAIQLELEHKDTIEFVKNNPQTCTLDIAKMIVLDHLKENPNYYDEEIASMAKGGEIEVDGIKSAKKYKSNVLSNRWNFVRNKQEYSYEVLFNDGKYNWYGNAVDRNEAIEFAKKHREDKTRPVLKELWEMDFPEFLSKLHLWGQKSPLGKNDNKTDVSIDSGDDTTTVLFSIPSTNSEDKNNEYIRLQLEKYHLGKLLEAIEDNKSIPNAVIDFYNSDNSAIYTNYGNISLNKALNRKNNSTISSSGVNETLMNRYLDK